MEFQHHFQKWSPRFLFLKGPKREPYFGPWGNSGFYSVGCMFPNHWDSGFHSIVDYLLEVVASTRLDFHSIGVEGEVSVGNNIVNTCKYCMIL